jgi:hypothetical protein
VVSLVLSIRGSRRAQAVWVGVLAYGIYNFAYYVFGAAFNDIFLVHTAVLTLSIWAIALAVPGLDVGAIAAAFGAGRGVRWIGAFLAIVGVILGGLWIVLAIRFAVTGELMQNIPAAGIHLVFAIDLSLLVPALVVAGVLLWRRTQIGVVFGAVMTVMGALYQVNLLAAGVFQANADVPGVKAFPLEGIVAATGFALSCAFLWGAGRGTGDRSHRGHIEGRRYPMPSAGTVLVVESEHEDRERLGRALEDEGYEGSPVRGRWSPTTPASEEGRATACSWSAPTWSCSIPGWPAMSTDSGHRPMCWSSSTPTADEPWSFLGPPGGSTRSPEATW